MRFPLVLNQTFQEYMVAVGGALPPPSLFLNAPSICPCYEQIMKYSFMMNPFLKLFYILYINICAG